MKKVSTSMYYKMNDKKFSTVTSKIFKIFQESECGKYMIGSCFIVEATREEVERFNQEDPFFAAKVWETISISR
jgi:hypothetical protein